MTLKEKIGNNIAYIFFSAIITGFVAGYVVCEKLTKNQDLGKNDIDFKIKQLNQSLEETNLLRQKEKDSVLFLKNSLVTIISQIDTLKMNATGNESLYNKLNSILLNQKKDFKQIIPVKKIEQQKSPVNNSSGERQWEKPADTGSRQWN